MRFRNIGQQVRADGPQGHLVKQGTPTMGGVLILLVVDRRLPRRWAASTARRCSRLGAMLACGLLGFVDDYAKVLKERSLGLTPRAKILWQGLIAVAVVPAGGELGRRLLEGARPADRPLSRSCGLLDDAPASGAFAIVVPWLYLVLVSVMLVSTSNTVNLTDGLDGLAAGTVMIVMFAFAAIAFRQNHLEVSLLGAAVAGSCIGFLWYNSYPADIFMGDTGSLGLGAAIAALAIVTKTELLLPLIGGIYVVEGLSVILQVASLQAHGQAHLPDGSDPPPLRDEGVVGDEGHGPVLDRHRHPGGRRVRAVLRRRRSGRWDRWSRPARIARPRPRPLGRGRRAMGLRRGGRRGRT